MPSPLGLARFMAGIVGLLAVLGGRVGVGSLLVGWGVFAWDRGGIGAFPPRSVTRMGMLDHCSKRDHIHFSGRSAGSSSKCRRNQSTNPKRIPSPKHDLGNVKVSGKPGEGHPFYNNAPQNAPTHT